MTTFTFYSDPGHGWLEVRQSDLIAVCLSGNKFSANGAYLQRRNDKVYLEEDCDAPKFLAAWEAKFGKPEIKEVYLNHRNQIGLL